MGRLYASRRTIAGAPVRPRREVVRRPSGTGARPAGSARRSTMWPKPQDAGRSRPRTARSGAGRAPYATLTNGAVHPSAQLATLALFERSTLYGTHSRASNRPSRTARAAIPTPPHRDDDRHAALRPERATYASRVDLIVAARRAPMPGTAAICSTGASRTCLIEPKTRSNARFRLGPTPGSSSNAERTEAFERSERWYVIAK